ncbi:hypothetical protein NIES2135_61910 (plasmid) [Leptolyngbya boryana NIES-2135]|jgi:hypothetical protein|uniref:Uncharacterized protein n=1 Tax=Leptolyngbya boryana NIES-2135 TaxID=1973484 RepID=A0A1Z4JRI8_LEPBY|nr:MULTISPECIES: hypothetical protein [Leptolyngbya]BAY59314.1 hypothetical protein NIES2135_61910 [Leptolyngbya boryana NIES-2135]MBD2372903.1 hypothetical protein [Leptolyngbya sp. FACHB-238]MBD2397344.1 hypothetical protein [Leptolyngbya sp. FACHB-239]MBD2403851.1 hypothetical protein [Leptolyngbya sp. FACHB-402]ULP33506.1 hypothetical protein MCP04_30730 [Leptolyngbya boryana IU 594]
MTRTVRPSRKPCFDRRSMIIGSTVMAVLLPSIALADVFLPNDGILNQAVQDVLGKAQNPIGDISSTISSIQDPINGVRTQVDGLIGQIQAYIQQFTKILPTQAVLQSQVGEYLKHIETAIQRNQGSLGLPDPSATRSDILNTSPQTTNIDGLYPAILEDGQITLRATNQFNQTILGGDAQKLHTQAMTSIAQSAADVGMISKNSLQVAQSVGQIAQGTQQFVQSSGQIAQTSMTQAGTVNTLAVRAKAAISTQDAIKFQAEQNGQIANILSGVSTQLAGHSSGLSSVATELSGISNQHGQASAQLEKIAAIQGDQAVSLRSIQVGTAVSIANLSDISQGMQGDRQRAEIARHDETASLTEANSNGFRMLR